MAGLPRPFAIDPAAFVQQHLPLVSVPDVPAIWLHLAAPWSGLTRLTGATPYWAYVWAGGAVLARFILTNPHTVRGKRILDLGAGSGLVGIVAAQAGAVVIAAETDPLGGIAIGLNAAANGVALSVTTDNLLELPLPDVDLILAGDLFYDPALVAPVLTCLRRATAAGIDVLIGDPGRAPLPCDHLRAISSYPVRDFGRSRPQPATIYRLRT